MDGFEEIAEGLAKVFVPLGEKVSKALPVFYNPAMRLNRDISVLLLKSLGNADLRIALPLAGTGVRAVRLIKELPEKMVGELLINDCNPVATEIICKNIEINGGESKIVVSSQEASRFLFSNSPYDYIDIDPFGSPNPFLDAAVKKVAIGGVLAVTATDTSCLCGSYTLPCRRKYWANPRNDFLMHEAGLRILIRKVQLIGAQFEKAFTPIISYAKDHYMRIFFICTKGKKRVDEILRLHGMLGSAGPLWLGRLNDPNILAGVLEVSRNCAIYDQATHFLELLEAEFRGDLADVVGFFDIHAISKRLKLKCIPRTSVLIDSIRRKGFSVSRTHFSPYGLRTDMPENDFLDMIR